jgi:hypothetical protein
MPLRAAAEHLNMSISTLNRRLKKAGYTLRKNGGDTPGHKEKRAIRAALLDKR